MSVKRARTASLSSSPDPEAPSTSKSSRTGTGNGTSAPLLCTLPPTCHKRATPLPDSTALERHYATHHAHVCEVSKCGCVFPDGRLLALHQTECHDPIAAVRQEQGDKIFACHLATCPKLFRTPKARRLHLIQAHAYPKEYFFAVTNKGVGGLLRKWGDGASMIRGTWRPRVDEGGDGEGKGKGKQKEKHEDGEDADAGYRMVVEEDDSDEDSDQESSEDEDEDEEGESTENEHSRSKTVSFASPPPSELDDLTDKVDKLALVPNAIRFGRGGRRGMSTGTGRVGRGRGRGGRGRGGSWVAEDEVEYEDDARLGRGRGGVIHIPAGRAGRGGGVRGRGRGFRGS